MNTMIDDNHNEEVESAAMVDGRDKVITLNEAAEILCVSCPTVYRMVTTGKLFGFRVNGGWRTSTAICRQYLAQQMSRQLASCRRKANR